MATPEQLVQFIRFGLQTLRERNGHHEFEAICLAVARRRVASNLLPATGPVSSGGDQGRDAESHWTNIPNEITADSAFVRLATTDGVVLACTMQAEQVSAKIKKDLKAICGAGEPIDRVVYFTVTPVEVAKRHELQQHARDEYNVGLDIWDAVGLARHLADPDLFYLAVQYLNVPTEMAPPPADDTRLPAWYQEHRARWRSRTQHPATLGELMDLRQGLRYATFHSESRADLADWLSYARSLLSAATEADVVLHARYEIAVATLRGTNTLRPADGLVRAFYAEVLSAGVDHSLLEDGLVLAQYCLGAIAQGLTDLSTEELAGWHGQMLTKIEALLDEQPHPNATAHLLALSARLKLFPEIVAPPASASASSPMSPAAVTQRVIEALDAVEPIEVDLTGARLMDVNGGMADLVQLCRRLPDAPLFPLESLGEIFDLLAPMLADHPAYRTVRDALDDATDRIMGQAAKADRARKRGTAFLNAGRLLDALNEIHDAKVNWWHGDTMRGALLAMLLVADIYSRLHLPLAAKHYALQAAGAARSSQQPDLAIFMARGILMAARYAYQAGSWLTATYTLRVALAAYDSYAEDPWDHERHPEVWDALAEHAIMLRIARDHRADLALTIETALAAAGLDDLLNQMLDGAEATDRSSEDDIALAADKQGVGRPFSDTGRTRSYTWRALGMTWTVHAANNLDAMLAAERFASAAQIVLAELASHDAVLLQGRIEVEIRPDGADLHRGAERLERISSNDASRWIVHLSRVDTLDVDAFHRELTSALVYILVTNSLLPFDRFMAVMNEVFERGLFHKLAMGRPYDEIATLMPEGTVAVMAAARGTQLGQNIPLNVATAPQLRPSGKPGPGYDRQAALAAVQARYDNGLPVIRYTLPRLYSDPTFRDTVAKLRDEGWLDWHFVNAVATRVSNERLRRDGIRLPPRNQVEAALMKHAQFRAERPDDFQLPASDFTEAVLRQQLNASVLSTLRSFGLQSHQQTPDFTAIFAVLGARYGYWTDDVDHEGIFPPSE
ncbi:hypothetical protein [Micromonospora sp. NPDC005313]|uniref:hypothetical protein n=1 Tax=Micromonospora sp. NPDC005313 TaxID=3154296 RepID=UPI0033AE63D2